MAHPADSTSSAPTGRPPSRRRGWLPATLLTAAVLLAGCSDGSPTDPPPAAESREVGVVVNSVEASLTLFDVEDPATAPRTVELGVPDATPVSASARGGLALVPMGVVPTATVIDLESASVLRTIPLPDGSGATGSIFLTDSTALVANPMRGTVTRVNVLRGTTEAEVEVGGYPGAFATANGRVAVVNAELVDFAPARTSTVTILDAADLAVLGTVELSGENGGAAVVGADGMIHVLNAGRWGEGTGSLSVVDIDLMEEVAHHEGFGDFPGGLVATGDGRLHVSSWNFGVIAWEPAQTVFHRGPADPIAPGGTGSAAGVASDDEGRLYTLSPECGAPSSVLRLGSGYQVEAEIPVGICPSALTFTFVEVPEGG